MAASSVSSIHAGVSQVPAAAAKNTPAAAPKTAHSPSIPSTVSLSAAAIAAFKEATEAPAQTSREANRGDHAAKALLAKESAQASRYK